MSTPVQRAYPPGGLQSPSNQGISNADAPKEPGAAAPSTAAPAKAPLAESPPLAPTDLKRLEREIAAAQARYRRRFEPFFPPQPPPAERKRSRWSLIGRSVAVAVAASSVTLIALGKFPTQDKWGAVSTDGASFIVALPPKQSDRAASSEKSKSAPRLVVEGASGDSGDAILLGARVEGPSEGLTAVISGLHAGTVLSTGKSWGSTGWIVPAVELGQTFLRPPKGFSGRMDYTIAIRRADGTVVDTQAMRLDWPETPVATEAAAPAVPAPPAAPAAPRQLDQDEIARLVKRGEQLFDQGDISSARLLLRRAAEARDARAALLLAATYDPHVLEKLGVHGFAKDVEKARAWYEKAKEYGSPEAQRRLEVLVSRGR